MDAYLGQVDFQTLVSQAYPPEPDVQDACYSELLAIANANRPSLGNVNIDQLLEFLLREVCGLGAIDSLIDDEAVTDFVVYNSEMIVADRQGRREITSLQFTSPDTLYLAAQRILSFQGLTDQTAPAVSEVRLGDGTQIEVVISPVSVSSTYVVVRKICRKFNALPALVQCDVLSNEMAKFLLLCVKARRNILVVGAQGSGRTSILNALGSEISDGERIVTIENSAMMMMPQLYVLSLEAQNSSVCQAGDLASLIRQASRLRAERVLVDTLQSPADASAFLGAIYAGAQGSMATISGLTANEGFNNLERMSCADNVNAGFAKIAGIIDIVVTTRAFSDASRRIVEISEVARTEDGGFVLVPIFEWNDSVMDKGQFRATGNIPEFYQALERGGVSLDPSIFNV
jgi:pilus assembly protein CpaF